MLKTYHFISNFTYYLPKKQNAYEKNVIQTVRND